MDKRTICCTKLFQVLSMTALSFLGSLSLVLAMEPSEGTASVKLSGEFRTRGFYTDNIDHPIVVGSNSGAEAFGDMRFRLRTKVTSEHAMGVIVADFVNGYCAPSVATVQSVVPLGPVAGAPILIDQASGCPMGTVPTGNARFGTGTAFGHSLNIVGVKEAYLMLNIKDTKLVAGRKHYRLGHGLVLSDTATGVAGRRAFGPITLTVADLNLGDPAAIGMPGTGTGDDSDFYLIKVTDTPPAGSPYYGAEKYQAYLGWLADPNGNLTYNGVSANEATMGLFGLSLHRYTYRTGGPVIDMELNTIWGSIEGAGAADPKISGMSAMAEVTMGKSEVTFVYGSGQDPMQTPATGGKLNVNALSANYKLGQILIDNGYRSDRDGGSLDVKGRGIVALKGAYKIVANEKHSADVAVIFAQTTEDASTTVASHNLGVEVGGHAECKLDKNLALSAGIGYLFAGKAWETLNTNTHNPIHLHVGATLSF
ncbi:MAG: hypothetical protein AAB035_04930 [Nitrospirota bacterium]